MTKLRPALFMVLPLVVVACGGAEIWGVSSDPASGGTIQYSSVTGPGPFTLNFSPSNGSMTTGSGPTFTKNIDLTKFVKTTVANLQELKIHLDDSTAVSNVYTLSQNGANRLVFSDKSSASTVWDAYAATSGTVQVDSVLDNTYMITLSNVVLVDSVSIGSGATFTMNGTVSVQVTFGS